MPATRPDFWAQKFEQNVLRDQRALAALDRLDWRIATVWECAIRKQGASEVGKKIQAWLTDSMGNLKIE